MKYFTLLLTAGCLSAASYAQSTDSTKMVQDSVMVSAVTADNDNVVTATVPKTGKSQQPFKVKPWLDIPLTLALDAWSVYGMGVIYGRDRIPEAEINGLDRKNI